MTAPMRRLRPVPGPRPPVTLLTVTEVAGQMRVSKMTVYRLIHSGELPASRVGRCFRVQARAVDEFLVEAAVDPS